jgi:hypothetical protein
MLKTVSDTKKIKKARDIKLSFYYCTIVYCTYLENKINENQILFTVHVLEYQVVRK